MSLKPRYKRRIFWTTITLIATLSVAAVVVPPMITLNNLKPKIEQTILKQTGINAKINGDVHFSLLGGTTIVAHNITIPFGTIGSAMFTMPLSGIFDINNADFTGAVSVYDATVSLDTLAPQNFEHLININNSIVRFQNKDYEIIRADLQGGHLIGTVRTNNHKYNIDVDGTEFVITNNNNNLTIVGQMYSDGTVRGRLAIKTDQINKFFEFSEPRITETIDLTTNFQWNGGTGFQFSNIVANNFTGNVELYPDGNRDIQIKSNDIDFDFSFLTDPSKLYNRTNFNLDLYGNLKFASHTFKHLKINAIGTHERLQISNIVADNITITGGYIDQTGAHNVMIMMPYKNTPAMCVFSGTPDNWKCSTFSYDNMSGSMSVNNNKFELFIQSDMPMPTEQEIIAHARTFAPTGTINFQYSNVAGTINVTARDITPSYTFAKNQRLSWLYPDIKFIPSFMADATGDFSRRGAAMEFIPHNKKWRLEITNNSFYLTGNNFKDWLPNIDLQPIKDMPYEISGTYRGNTISNLIVKFGGMEFTGAVNGRAITLGTPLFNIDTIANQNFIDNYEELSFLTAHPLTLPFDVPVNISLRADRLIYNGIDFANFVYSLKDGTQIFSISDTNRGNLLGTIERQNNKYDIFIQLNKFVTNGDLLSPKMPLNLRDTRITAEIALKTHGNIAHDLEYNMSGDMDLIFDGGYIIGLGFDKFYASANQITSFNAEYALSDALDGGQTALKKMHIMGKYENGNFITSRPFTLSMRHIDATGEIDISDGQMMVMLNMIMRGTAPEPSPINMRILPGGARDYSISDIMRGFDSEFMRAFTRTHNKF